MADEKFSPPDLGADGPAALRRHVVHASYRGKITARTVVDGILEQLHAASLIDARQMAAGVRLRYAYQHSWKTRVAGSQALYASDPGLDETDDRDLSPEEREKRARELHRTWTEAMHHLGELRHVTLGLCGGPVIRRGAQFGLIGLKKLADFWGIEDDA